MRQNAATVSNFDDSAHVRPMAGKTEIADEALVERARSGDRWAEEALYRRHVQAVTAAATRLLRCQTEAQDVVQDTFVSAFREIKQLREPSAFRAWLMQIAVRQVHRRFRRRKLQNLLGMQPVVEDVTLSCRAVDSTDPELMTELRLMDRVLNEIAASERICWMLRYVEGYSLAEVAQIAECSLATAKRKIARASNRMKDHIRLPELDHE